MISQFSQVEGGREKGIHRSSKVTNSGSHDQHSIKVISNFRELCCGSLQSLVTLRDEREGGRERVSE